jgi:molybdopterin-guanine dinucleotide biosynthesis protein A
MVEETGRAVARVGGYVLAGGRSSRMGREKALLELADRPLIAHAVAKLRRVTGEANILAGEAPGNPALGAFGPLVFDLHPGCGPMAGIEAALSHSSHDWNVILPVDVPFLPATYLQWWVELVTRADRPRSPVAMFYVDGRPQTALLLVRRQVRPFLTEALGRGTYKLYPVLEEAVRQLAAPGAPLEETIPYLFPVGEILDSAGSQGSTARLQAWQLLAEAQRRGQSMWFANLNTPGDFARAAEHLNALDPPE